MSRLTPTLHPDYQVGVRVEAELEPGRKVLGEIGGVAFVHAIFSYIVILDIPIEVPDWPVPWKAITVPGGLLRPLE